MTRPPQPRAGQRHVKAGHSGYLSGLNWEPVSGFEALTCMLRRYGPLEPWFDKTRQPSEIQSA